jgi:hypothetical protein
MKGKDDMSNPKAHASVQNAHDTAYCPIHCVVYDAAAGCPYCGAAPARKSAKKGKTR